MGLGNFTFSSDGSKLNFVSYGGSMKLFDFDRCTGLMSNANIILIHCRLQMDNFLGSAFSPNDSLFYIIKGVYYPFIYCSKYIYSQGYGHHSTDNRNANVVNREVPWLHQVCSDGKIYMTASYTDTLGYFYFPLCRFLLFS